MKLHWLLPGYLGMFLLASPAEAAKLQSWRFDEQQNRLEFRTDEGVQPKAQLITNPTRLVLDLPGTTLGRPMVNQSLSGAIRSVRVGQFDRQTTRIVVELAPGYTLDPAQVKVRGISPTQWTVDLPTPQRVAEASGSAPAPVAQSSSPPPRPSPAPRPAPTGATQLESVQVTPDGFFVRVSGRAPELKVRRSSDRRKVTIDLPDSTVSPQLTQSEMAINRFGVNRLIVTQEKEAARITLEVDRQAPEFRAIASSLGGVVIIPTGNVVVSDRRPSEVNPASALVTPPSTGSTPAAQPKIATIEGVDLRGNQLVIQANEALTYTSGWDRETNAYRIALPSAQLAEDLKGPTLDASSPLLRIRLRQENETTVAILLQPAAGVRIGELSAAGQRSLSVPLERSQIGVTPPPGGSTVSVPTASTNPNQPLPTAPRGRIVVVIDPGHGGPDPGAVGINGLNEVDIVDPISKEVASLLERQGVQAVLTRRENIDLDLEPRVALAERVNATLFVSIHANSISMSRPDVNGLETYYYASGERLARTIHNVMVQETGARDRGVRQARFYVLRRTSMPAVLIETGFVTGSEDAANLSRPEYRSRLAAAIARGILQYIQQNY